MSFEPDVFCRSIWGVINSIPSGCVMSYGEVAKAAGYQNSARRVSFAMRQAPEYMKLPWHRVLQSDGKIAFPEGSEKYILQRTRLEREAIGFVKNRVVIGQHSYTASLDEVLWKL